MTRYPLNPYQLLFFNREINFGNPKSNVLKGSVEILGGDYERFKNAVYQVLKTSEWTYFRIDKNQKSWTKENNWNGRFENYFFETEISIDGQLWSVCLEKIDANKIKLGLFLHHCLGDAHSFNLFWNAVYEFYKKGSFQEPFFTDELNHIKNPDLNLKKDLPNNLGVGKVKRMTYKFSSRVWNHLNSKAVGESGSLMAFLLEKLETELKICENHLGIALRTGIALRNRRNNHQKNSFSTFVNFLPLPEDNNPMQKRIMNLFRIQGYPLIDLLTDKQISVAFNVLFSYQKESYNFGEDLELNFKFESSTADDNIISIHLLEYGDNSFVVHFDFRTDIASEYYWQSFVRSITRKVIAFVLSKEDRRIIYKSSKLISFSQEYNEFWHYFDQVNGNEFAIICGEQNLTFFELRRKIEEAQIEPINGILKLKKDREIENIIQLLAAWKKGYAISYHDFDPNIKQQFGKIAYLAKTSGTSGKEKTILISFDALKSLIPDWKRIYKTKNSVHLSLADQGFDVFFGDLLRSILSGETLVLASEEERLDASKIDLLIQNHQITHFESTPSFLNYLLPNIRTLNSLKVIICGSEQVNYGFYRLTQKQEFQHIDFFNSYGLTESTIDSAVSKLKINNDGFFPSGNAVGDQSICIKGKDGDLKPMGTWGEICIEGTCVGMNISETIETNYLATGDMGMIVPSDGLLVGGRINDDFIKVNGRRIPASLIESKISELNDVQNCICLEIENAAVVFIKGKITEYEVKNRLAETFTKYQLPDVYFFCNNWPINQNGKVDRKELTERFKEQRRNRVIWKPTENQLEKILFTCIEARGKLFGSADDSLITFGWNSIELLSLANELNMKGVFVPLASFIQNPSISFILSLQENTTDNQTAEDPSTNDFDIDDILSVMNE